MINRTSEFSKHADDYVPLWHVLDRSPMEAIVPVIDRRELEQHLACHPVADQEVQVSAVKCSNAVLVDDPARHRTGIRCPTMKWCMQLDVRSEYGASRARLLRFGSLFRASDFVQSTYGYNVDGIDDVRAPNYTLTASIIRATARFSPALRKIGCAVTAELSAQYGGLVVAYHLRGDDSPTASSLMGPSLNKSPRLFQYRLARLQARFEAAINKKRARGHIEATGYVRSKRSAAPASQTSAVLLLLSNLDLKTIERNGL